MVLFMMLRHGPENLTMYTTVGDESPADKINELRPARGIMDDFNPSMRSIQNNPVKPVPESSVVDGKDEEVFDWSKVPPHLRGAMLAVSPWKSSVFVISTSLLVPQVITRPCSKMHRRLELKKYLE